MPTWLVHGFRWPRVAIRIHIILENLEDCAAEWLMAPATTAQLTENFHKQFPEQLAHLPSLRFIEQYDPDDECTKDQPYAYVCDQVTEINLGVDIDEVRGLGVQSDTWSALVELRDKVAPGEKVGWFVVVNGDVERWAPSLDNDADEQGSETELSVNDGRIEQNPMSPVSQRSSVARSDDYDARKQRGLKKWFGKMRKAGSIKDLRNADPSARFTPTSASVPPVPSVSNDVGHSRTISHGKAPASAEAH